MAIENKDRLPSPEISRELTIVVKLGGAEGNQLETALSDVAELVRQNHSLIIIHGGSDQINSLSEKLNHPPRHVTSPSGFSSRYTDAETLDIFTMAMGLVNKEIVTQLQSLGVNAIGLTGVDGQLLTGKRKESMRIIENGKTINLRDHYGGKIEAVNTDLLHLLLEANFTPVITPLALSHDRERLNVDADATAAEITQAISADILVILSNIPGLLQDVNDPSSLVSEIPLSQLDAYLDQFAHGRMKLKLKSIGAALKGETQTAIIADSRLSHPLFSALAGQGTVISK